MNTFLFVALFSGPALAAGPSCSNLFSPPPHPLVKQLLVLRAEIELQSDRSLAKLLYREYQAAYSEARALGVDLSRLNEASQAKQEILNERAKLKQEKLKEAINLNAWVPHSVQSIEGFYQGIVALADGKSIAVINANGRFEVRSDEGKVLETKFEVGRPGRYRMRISEDQKVVAVTDVDEVTGVFDIASGTKLLSFKGKEPELSSDGSLVAVHRYGQVDVRRTDDPVNVTRFTDKFRFIPQALQFSKDGKSLHATIPGEKLFLTWNLSAKRTQKSSLGSSENYAIHPTTNKLVLPLSGEAPAVLELKSKTALGSLEPIGKNLASVSFSPNGETIAGTNSSGNIYFWSTKTKALVSTLKLPVPNAKFAFSADGSRLIVTEAILMGDPRVWIYKVASEAE